MSIFRLLLSLYVYVYMKKYLVHTYKVNAECHAISDV